MSKEAVGFECAFGKLDHNEVGEMIGMTKVLVIIVNQKSFHAPLGEAFVLVSNTSAQERNQSLAVLHKRSDSLRLSLDFREQVAHYLLSFL